MHGTSPFEIEFSRGSTNSGNSNDDGQYGQVRIVECTHLKILGEVPFPPWAAGSTGSNLGNSNLGNSNDLNVNDGDGISGTNGKYPLSIYQFIRYMVNHDRSKRPNIQEVAKRFADFYFELIGERWVSYEDDCRGNEFGKGLQNYDDFDSLIASRDFV